MRLIGLLILTVLALDYHIREQSSLDSSRPYEVSPKRDPFRPHTLFPQAHRTQLVSQLQQEGRLAAQANERRWELMAQQDVRTLSLSEGTLGGDAM